jgi:hypothetical protein
MTMKTTDRTGSRLQVLTEALGQLGYEPGAPKHCREAALLDSQAYQEATCPECGHLGLDLHPFRRGRVYKALCSCHGCGFATEA